MAGLGRRTHYRKHLTDSVLFDLPLPGPSERIAKIVATRGTNQFDVLVASDAPPSSPSAAPDSAPSVDADGADAGSERPERSPQLAILPTKFRKLVWVKRNDYVIVDTGINSSNHTGAGDPDPEESPPTTDKRAAEAAAAAEPAPSSGNDGSGGGIRCIVTHILYKEQVKHLKAEGLWPSHDPEFAREDGVAASSSAHAATAGGIDRNAGGDEAQDEGNEGDVGSADDGIGYDGYCDDGDGDGDDDDVDLFVNTNRVAALRVDDSSSSSGDEE